MVKGGNKSCCIDVLDLEDYSFLLVSLIEDSSFSKWRNKTDFSFTTSIACFSSKMTAVNLKFIYANLLRAAELRVPVDVIFDEDLSKTIHAWEKSLRMDSLSITIALLNVIATTLQFSSVSRSSDGRYQVPLNFYNMIVARSCMMITLDSI